MARNKPPTIKTGFLGRSRKFVRLGIFMTLFALLGVGLLFQSQAASQPSVRFVLFCPSSGSCSGNVDDIQVKAKKVRAWYKNKLGNDRTFRLLQTKKVIGAHSAAWYYNYGSYSSEATFNRIQKDDYGRLNESNVKTVVILGFRSMSNCGAAGGWLAIVDPHKGCGSFQGSVYAHELGHTWGLNHKSDGSLMHDPAACNSRSLGNCPLNSDQRRYLLDNRSSWFPSGATASIASADDVVPDDGTSFQDPVQLVEYYHDANKDSFFTISRNDALYAQYGWRFMSHTAHVLSGPDYNLAPFKRYYNWGNKHHFYTIKPETACFGSPIENCGYQYQSTEGYVYKTQAIYTMQFKNYVNGNKNHYYTYHPQNACGGYDIAYCGYSFHTNIGYVYQ